MPIDREEIEINCDFLPDISKPRLAAKAAGKAAEWLSRSPDDDVQAFGLMLADRLARGAGATLAVLSSRGGISVERADALAERDRLLVRLWQSSNEWKELPPPAAGRLMALAIARYEATRWPRERDALSAPSAEPAATWWRTLRISGRAIGAKRLQQILEAEIQ